jgi:hypothetical protein
MSSQKNFVDDYHVKFHVEQLTSHDGELHIDELKYAPIVSPVTRVMNHNRTLRASYPLLKSGIIDGIIIERAGDRSTYVLRGTFHLLQENLAMHWVTPTSISFVGETYAGIWVEYVVDVRTLAYTQTPISIKAARTGYQEQVQIID